MLKFRLIILLSFFCFGLFSCKTNKLNVNVSEIEVNLEIRRFDLALYNANIDSISITIKKLENNFNSFYRLFNEGIIKIGDIDDINYEDYFIDFVTNYTVSQLLESVHTEYEDIADIEQQLINAFKHYKYYFPSKSVPEILSFVAGFNQSIVIDSNILAIGFDKYLGPNNQIYNYLGVPKYKIKNMNRNMIVPDCMRAIAMTEYEFYDSVDNLIANMIYEGKILYFIDAMMPEIEDKFKIGYTENELNWCRNSEKNMWTYLVEEKLLFTSDYMQIKRYIDDSPFTPTFSQDSPGRTGIWIGWQIVRSYMNNNHQKTLIDLMKENNYQKILNESKYKP